MSRGENFFFLVNMKKLIRSFFMINVTSCDFLWASYEIEYLYHDNDNLSQDVIWFFFSYSLPLVILFHHDNTWFKGRGKCKNFFSSRSFTCYTHKICTLMSFWVLSECMYVWFTDELYWNCMKFWQPDKKIYLSSFIIFWIEEVKISLTQNLLDCNM